MQETHAGIGMGAGAECEDLLTPYMLPLLAQYSTHEHNRLCFVAQYSMYMHRTGYAFCTTCSLILRKAEVQCSLVYLFRLTLKCNSMS